jgi:excisionase family DNA binding protein
MIGIVSILHALVRREKASTIGNALPEWLTVDAAANYLKVHRTTIYDLCDRGVLPYFELKGARGRRFKREDLDALLEPGGQTDGDKTTRTR